jgi:hypothetical protein
MSTQSMNQLFWQLEEAKCDFDDEVDEEPKAKYESSKPCLLQNTCVRNSTKLARNDQNKPLAASRDGIQFITTHRSMKIAKVTIENNSTSSTFIFLTFKNK